MPSSPLVKIFREQSPHAGTPRVEKAIIN